MFSYWWDRQVFCTPLSLGFHSGMFHTLKWTKNIFGNQPEFFVCKLVWIFEIPLEVCSYIRQFSFCRDRQFLVFYGWLGLSICFIIAYCRLAINTVKLGRWDSNPLSHRHLIYSQTQLSNSAAPQYLEVDLNHRLLPYEGNTLTRLSYLGLMELTVPYYESVYEVS